MDTRWLRLDLRLLSTSQRGAGRASPSHFRRAEPSVTQRRDLHQRARQKTSSLRTFSRQGVVTLSEIAPIWTINQQAKSLKSLASILAIVGKFRSV